MDLPSLPLRSARIRPLLAAVTVVALAAGAQALPAVAPEAAPAAAETLPASGVAGGTEAYEASVVPARFDPGARTGPPPLAGPRAGSGLAGVPAGGVVVDLEAVDPEGEPLAGTRLQHPAVRLHGEAPAGTDPVTAAADVEGVSLATEMLVGSLVLATEDADVEIEVAAVDPAAFRLLTPRVTAEAVDVWRRIAEGDAAFVHEVGYDLQHEHGVDLGARVPLAGGAMEGEEPESDGGADRGLADPFVLDGRVRSPSAPSGERRAAPRSETLRVGAYASNGAPPVADVVVSRETAETLELTGETVVLVALEDGADAGEVASRLEGATGLEAQVVPQPSVRRAFLSRGASSEAFEPFTYVSLGDGMIQIERDWVQSNIVTADVPILRGQVTCHRLMIPQLRGALQEVEDAGLAGLIDPGQYGGCWVPRHILFNPRRAISMHAWGLAIDFNVSTNGYGAEPTMDARVVEIFERWGFEWGGHWSTPDGMHFELAALLHSGD